MWETDSIKAYEQFVDSWQDSSQEMKAVFMGMKEHMEQMDGVVFDFVGRAGITYSLRVKHRNQKDRSLFAMIDVIDDDPADRWLSVCFYGDLITDPDEVGDLVPEGLLGEDGHCFDLSEPDDDEVAYIKERLAEGCKNASK